MEISGENRKIQRTQLTLPSRFSRVGTIESVILYLAVKHQLKRFTLSNIQLMAREELHLKIDRRRLWDAAQRLVKRDILTREQTRGWYTINIDISDLDPSLFTDKIKSTIYAGNDSKDRVSQSERSSRAPSLACRGMLRSAKVRIHSNAPDLLGIYRYFLFAERILSAKTRELRKLLILRYGVPASKLNKISRDVVKVADEVLKYTANLGCHGRYGRSMRCGTREELLPISLCYGGKYEKGADIDIPWELGIKVVKVVGGKLFVKIYIDPPHLRRYARSH